MRTFAVLLLLTGASAADTNVPDSVVRAWPELVGQRVWTVINGRFSGEPPRPAHDDATGPVEVPAAHLEAMNREVGAILDRILVELHLVPQQPVPTTGPPQPRLHLTLRIGGPDANKGRKGGLDIAVAITAERGPPPSGWPRAGSSATVPVASDVPTQLLSLRSVLLRTVVEALEGLRAATQQPRVGRVSVAFNLAGLDRAQRAHVVEHVVPCALRLADTPGGAAVARPASLQLGSGHHALEVEFRLPPPHETPFSFVKKYKDQLQAEIGSQAAQRCTLKGSPLDGFQAAAWEIELRASPLPLLEVRLKR